jgi:redox-sensitive bicupin YhaK (pirin superfamily)
MFNAQFPAALNPVRSQDARSLSELADGLRPIALLAKGHRNGPVTRLITPWSIGELTRPFILVNYAEVGRRSRLLFRNHAPHGVATLTVVLNGELSFEDSTGKRGGVPAAGFAWMEAGSIVWHEGGPASPEPLRVFQIWIAHRSASDGSTGPSQYVAANQIEEDGPVRVVLGEFGRARSRIRHAPADINCFHVCLKDRQQFRYAAPDTHNVTWVAVDRGGLQLQLGEPLYREQIAVFGDSAGMIEAQAEGETSFVIGSARRHVPESSARLSRPSLA